VIAQPTKGSQNFVTARHNAPFDIAFLDQEFRFLKGKCMALNGCVFRVFDTLQAARNWFPRQDNSLEGLCKAHGIVDKRDKHSALEDAQLLAKLCMVWFS
jgi:DNA polymerase-3 subunit epsilon